MEHHPENKLVLWSFWHRCHCELQQQRRRSQDFVIVLTIDTTDNGSVSQMVDRCD